MATEILAIGTGAANSGDQVVTAGTGGLNLSGTLPMDAVSGVTWTAAYGFFAVTSAWTAAGMNLLDFVGGTLKTAKGGYPDIKAFAATLGIDPYSGSGAVPVTGAYDQSGNGRYAAQTNNANRPWIGLVNGRFAFGFGSVLTMYIDHPAMADHWLDLPASVVMNTQSLSVFALVKPYTTTSRTASSVTNYFGAGTLSTIISNAGFALYSPNSFFAGTAGSTAHLYDLSNFANYGLDAPNIGIQNQVVYGILGPSGGKYGANGTSQTGAAITAAAPTGGRIGASVGTFGDSGFGGRMYAVLISSTIFDGAQEFAMKSAFNNVLNIPTSPMIAGVTIDGASLDQGQGGVPGTLYTPGEQNGGGFGWPEFLMDELSSYARHLLPEGCSWARARAERPGRYPVEGRQRTILPGRQSRARKKAVMVVAAGTYRFSRIATSDSCGVFSA